MITVTCRKRDPAVKIVPKYDNISNYDVTPANPVLPNGVYGYRHLRKTNPDKKLLSPLAAWIVEQLDGKCIVGTMPTLYDNIEIDTDISEAQAWRYLAGGYGLCHTKWYADPARALDAAEGWIHSYSMENDNVRISSYLISIIEPEESDEQYWNGVAESIVSTGGNRVIINDKSFPLPGILGVRYTHNFSGKTVRIPHGVDIRTVDQAIAERARIAVIEQQEKQTHISDLKNTISILSWWKQAFLRGAKILLGNRVISL